MKVKWKVMLRVIIYHKKLSVYEKMMGCWEKKIVFEWKTNLLKIIPKCRTLNAWASLNGNPFMKIFYSSNSYFLLLFHTQTSFQSFTFFYSIFYISLFSLLYFSTFFCCEKVHILFIHSFNQQNKFYSGYYFIECSQRSLRTQQRTNIEFCFANINKVNVKLSSWEETTN